MQQNLYRFSGAKTYQQLKEMNTQLIDSKGKIRSFNQFKNAVLKVHKTYNKDYLQAEYQTAKSSAQMARKWQGFENDQDLFPNLKYRTIGDARVREEHAALDGIIRPVNHAFWNTHYPPNGWRCRCSVQQTTDAETTDDININIEESFNNNVGKTKQLFLEKKHPYFVIPKGDKTNVTTKINGLLAIHSAKEIVKFGKKWLVGNTYKTIDKKPFTLSTGNLKTITKKPHNDRVGRNNLLYSLKPILKNAKFIKSLPEGKNRSKYVEWFYYKVDSKEGTYYLNIVLLKDGKYILHAITDTIK